MKTFGFILTFGLWMGSLFAVDAMDEKGLVFHLTLDQVSNGMTPDQKGKPTGKVRGAKAVPGVTGNALAFDSAEKTSVTVADRESLSAEAITISFWMKPAGKQKDGQLVCKMTDGKGGYRISLQEGRIAWQIPNEDKAWSHRLAATQTIPENEWTFVAVTYDGNVMKIFIDGAEAGTAERVGKIIPRAVDFAVGAWDGSGAAGYHGFMDEVKVYRIALDKERIQAAWRATLKKRL